MKLLHLGDIHLGKSLGDFDLYKDQKYILDQILGIVKYPSELMFNCRSSESGP